MAKTERIKILQAGDFWYAIQYTSLAGGVSKERRAAKHGISSQVREKINVRTSIQKLWLILVSTFEPKRDLFVSLTYRDDDLPKTPEEANKRLKAWFRELRKYRRERGQDMVYVYSTEGLHSGMRYHHHVLINGTGDDYEIMRQLWEKNGDQVEIHPYYKKTHWEHAQYLTKEPREKGRRHVGDRMWKQSRNVKRPVVTYDDAPVGSDLQPPPGAYVADRSETINTYGRFQYLECRLNYSKPNKKKSDLK